MSWEEFNNNLIQLKQRLIQQDHHLDILFNEVSLDFRTLIKPVYVALIGAIIGQKIKYTQAKRVRSGLYQKLGVNFNPEDVEKLSDIELRQIGLSSLNINIIRSVNNYLILNNVKLNTIDEVKKLKSIKGIGDWTIKTTLLTSMMDWSIFPSNDIFIRERIKRLYGLNLIPDPIEVDVISQKWAPYQGIVCWYLWRYQINDN